MKLCVFGAGVAGVTAAYELARRGHSVTVVDRQPAAGMECSYANGGQLSYAHAEPWANPGVFPKLMRWMWQDDAPLVLRFSADPHMIRWGLLFLLNCLPARAHRHCEIMLRLGLYSKQMFARIMEQTQVPFHHLARGTLHIFREQAAFDYARRHNEFQSRLGCTEQPMTPQECFALEPALADTAMPIVGGMFAPIDESGDIHVFTQGLAAYCAQYFGTEFRYGVGIKRLFASGGALTHAEIESDGEPQYLSGFDGYVMALGAGSAPLLRQIGLRVPIYPMKGYSISFDISDACPTVSITDDGAKQVYTRLGNRMRVAGTAEFAGYNDAVRAARIAPLKAGMQLLFPKAPMENLSEWACLRPSTPDGPPVIGATPLDNLYINSGQGTLGWTQAAGSAALLADVIDGASTAIPLDGLTFDRY